MMPKAFTAEPLIVSRESYPGSLYTSRRAVRGTSDRKPVDDLPVPDDSRKTEQAADQRSRRPAGNRLRTGSPLEIR